ncbi:MULTISPECIES: hypothetical protein [unclassified Dyella]|uniref:hypothetical protein n=1 Tax=unclassified Dyella TaxID=2634549 RepID=UPI0020325D0A|nr:MULTISPECIES: hypothetical protein [unclassified Dyella]
MTQSNMHRSPRRLVRCALSVLFALALAPLAVQAAPQSSGLGQAWPNAPDVSASPHWHVYVFERDGVRFVQVNDVNGRVMGAFATAGGQFLVLPMGIGASLSVAPAGSAVPANGELVYSDGTVQLTAAPAADGSLKLRAFDLPCTDPVECSTHIAPQ